MPLFHFGRETAHRHIQPHRLVEYTAVGAAAGAAAHGLGAVVLHPFDPDHFDRTGSVLAGLAGGAAIHAIYGGLAACAKTRRSKQELRRLAGSTVLSATLGGLVGAAVLSAAGQPEHPGPGHLVLAGITGGAILGTGAAALRVAHHLCCLCWPRWLVVDEASDHDSIFGDEHAGIMRTPESSASSQT